MRLSSWVGILVMVLGGSANAQGFGGGGAGGYGGAGSGSGTRSQDGIPVWNPSKKTDLLAGSGYFLRDITYFQGTAEVRVVPEEIRVVLAVTSEAPTAPECLAAAAKKIAAVRQAWVKMNIPEERVVEDFISVLPRYEWHLVDRDGEKAYVEQLVGHRMQRNLHVTIQTEKQATAAIDAAFEQGITDIVTFDYWSSQLGDQLNVARKLALEAAQKKADLLLTIFPEKPQLVDVAEESGTFFPREMYRTFENALTEEQRLNWQPDHDTQIRQIHAYRPQLTFLDGIRCQADVRAPQAMLGPEIIVVSTVTLAYARIVQAPPKANPPAAETPQ